MPLAFVLITTAPGKEAEIYKKVRDCPNVSYVYPLFGEYDLIAKVIIDKNHPYEVSEPWRADSIGT